MFKVIFAVFAATVTKIHALFTCVFIYDTKCGNEYFFVHLKSYTTAAAHAIVVIII